MTWVDTTVKERDFQNGFLDLLEQHGWKLASHFKKIAVDSKWVDPQNPKLPDSKIEFHMAEHFIYESKAGFKYGIAYYGMQSMMYGTVATEKRPVSIWKPVSAVGGTDYIAEPNAIIPMADWITNLFPPAKLSSTIYMYMVDEVDETLTTNEDVAIIWPGNLKQACLDVEVKRTKGFSASGSFAVQVQENLAHIMQSPLAQANFRIPTIEQRLVQYGENGVIQNHNVWQDSVVRLTGQITPSRLLLTIQADTAAAFEENGVPSIPLFWGPLQTTKFTEEVETYAQLPTEPKPDTSYIVLNDEKRGGLTTEYIASGAAWEPQLMHDTLITGSAFDVAKPTFDFDSVTPLRSPMLPLLKGYTSTPSNGVDTVMCRRSHYGSRYQSHYLSWNTASNNMPPDRISHDGRKYPRAWLSNKEQNDEYNYRFNVSRYTERVHTSRIYVIHPEEGVRGWIPFAIGFNPLSLVPGDKLKVKRSACPDVFEIYKYTLIESVSPFTKRPGTAYRPMGIGVFSDLLN